MLNLDPSPLLSLVGPTDVRCWELVRNVYRDVQGVVLPENPFDALDRFFDVPQGEPPRAWDIVVICHKRFITNHVGVMIDPVTFVHSMKSRGLDEVTIGYVMREPYSFPGRIAGYNRFRE